MFSELLAHYSFSWAFVCFELVWLFILLLFIWFVVGSLILSKPQSGKAKSSTVAVLHLRYNSLFISQFAVLYKATTQKRHI